MTTQKMMVWDSMMSMRREVNKLKWILKRGIVIVKLVGQQKAEN
jgi:hypothetical protein